jgi:hypothetical protein
MNEIPPKLNQLLQQMHDVDKVKLLQIAQHYKMDLDDPGFLPLLLTKQGIEALESAKNELIREAGGTVTFALSKAQQVFDESSKSKSDELEKAKETALIKINECASESELAIKNAVQNWSLDVFCGAINEALHTELPSALANAKKSADSNAKTMNQSTELFALAVARAVDKIENSARDISMNWMLIVGLFCLLVGAGVGFFAATKVGNSERINTEQIAQNIVKSCSKK